MAEPPIVPFTIDIPESGLQDLKTRLSLTRYAKGLELGPGTEWDYGTPEDVMKELVDYWQNGFDWRKAERELNEKLPQFTTDIDAGDEHGVIKIHFAHKRSKNPKAIPLLFSHGWPGNFAEVMKMVDDLTDPQDPAHPAFHVVSPSIPGFCFSEASKAPGLGLKKVAFIYNTLMNRLGYKHYLCQAGDWGAFIVRAIAVWHPDNCRGVLSNMLLGPTPTLFTHPIRLIKIILGFIGLPGGYSKVEIDGLKEVQSFIKHETGYQKIQETKPQTLGYGLTDSPAALLAWIREKLTKWTDSYDFTRDEVLTWVTLYWFSTAGPVGSIRFYREAKGRPGEDERKVVLESWSPSPLGVSLFPKEVYRMPEDFGSMVQPLKFFRRHEKGGHFAAWEVPHLLTEDMRTFASIVVKDDRTLQMA